MSRVKSENGNEQRLLSSRRILQLWYLQVQPLECVTFHPFLLLCFLNFRLRWFWFRENSRVIKVLYGYPRVLVRDFQVPHRHSLRYSMHKNFIFYEYWYNGESYTVCCWYYVWNCITPFVRVKVTPGLQIIIMSRICL